MIIERSISARSGFQAIVEIQHDLVQRKFIEQQHASRADVFELLLVAALLFEQLQDLANIFFARDDSRVDNRLFDLLNRGRVRELLRIIDLQNFAVSGRTR